MSEKQKLIGVDDKTKEIIDKNFKQKGFSTRAKYLKHLVEKDDIIINNANPQLLE